MFTIWLCACGPYGGESGTICKWSGAIELPPENPQCNQGDRWHGHCCGLTEKNKITFNKLWLQWARAPQKVRLSVKLRQQSCIGGNIAASSLFSSVSIWLSLNYDLFFFFTPTANCPLYLAEAGQQITRFIVLLKEIENMMSSILGTNSWQDLWRKGTSNGPPWFTDYFILHTAFWLFFCIALVFISNVIFFSLISDIC